MLYFKAKSFEEIYNNSNYIINFWIMEIIIFIIMIIFIFSLVFYMIPIEEIIWKIRKNSLEWRKKRKILNQIMAQKEIESEIEEEIKNYNLKS